MILAERNTILERWRTPVLEDHRLLKKHAEVLDSALEIDTSDPKRRVVLSWVLRNLWPEMELHLRQEEEALFPALEHLLDSDSGALAMLRKEHSDLRAGFRHLAELLQDPTHLEWDRIDLAVDGFLYLLEEHERMSDRPLLDVLQHNLSPEELPGLAQAYRKVAEKAHEEAGWLKSY